MKTIITDTGKSITELDIALAEKKISKKFPDEYKSFLIKHNGGRPQLSGFDIEWSDEHRDEVWVYDHSMVHFFIDIDLDENNDATTNLFGCFDSYEGQVPSDTIPIAYDPGGNLILIGVEGENRGKIFFWLQEFETEDDEDTDYSNVGFVANTFNEFIDSLFDPEERL